MSEIIRRDPRREWIARNRLHPEHASVLAALGVNRSGGGGAVSEWLGPNGVVRKNPRAIGFIGPNGVKRIDRSGLQQGGQSTATTAATRDSRRTVVIDHPAFLVAVVPDLTGGRLSGHDKDLLGLARRVADADAEQPGAVVAILFGEHKGEGAASLRSRRWAKLGSIASCILMMSFMRGLLPRHVWRL